MLWIRRLRECAGAACAGPVAGSILTISVSIGIWFSRRRTPEANFFPGKKVGFQPQNMPQLAFPESVRAVDEMAKFFNKSSVLASVLFFPVPFL